MTSAEILVDTFREGALSLLGHDLRLAARDFELSATNGQLTGSVELATLHVLGCMRKNRLDPSAPSPSERAEIEQRMREGILKVDRHPRASLTGTVQRDGTRWSVTGTLILCGRAQPIGAAVEQRGDSLETSLTLTPSAYGIAPFRALGGALRIADRVVVHVRLPLPAAIPGYDLAALTAGWQRPSR
jgi:hypothetical protein